MMSNRNVSRCITDQDDDQDLDQDDQDVLILITDGSCSVTCNRKC